MTPEEIKQSVSELFPNVTYDETGEFLNVLTDSKELKPMMVALRNQKEFDFEYLFCLTCIDWKTHLTMVYHMLSKSNNHTIVVKAKIADINKPEIETVCDIWETANFHEREVFDLFGVKFLNHPDLRRIFLDDEWDGFPLRKNYVDENMIEI